MKKPSSYFWHDMKAKASGTTAPAAGVVRSIPTGLTASPVRKRYQYQRSGCSPVTSTCTLYPSSIAAVARPFCTTLAKRSSSATSQSTAALAVSMPPSGSSGRGARRVQSTAPPGVGSPEATPRVNGSSAKRGRSVTRQSLGTTAVRAARRARSARKSRRSMGGGGGGG